NYPLERRTMHDQADGDGPVLCEELGCRTGRHRWPLLSPTPASESRGENAIVVRGSQQEDFTVIAAEDQVEMVEDVAAEDAQVVRRRIREGGELALDFRLAPVVAGQEYDGLHHHEPTVAAHPLESHALRSRERRELQ